MSLENHRKASQSWRQKNPEKSREASRRWAEANADRIKDKRLQRKFGITLTQYSQMLADQGETCAICQGASSGKGGFHVDHDHATGRVRGLLCYRCNVAIGLFDEDLERLRKAGEYLERTK